MGHNVYSAEGFAEAFELCDRVPNGFDLMVPGRSIPHEEATRSVDATQTRDFVKAVEELLNEHASKNVRASG